MKLFGMEIMKSVKFADIFKKAESYDASNIRPRMARFFGFSSEMGLPLPYNVNMLDLYDIAYFSDVLTVVQNALNNEIFRNGSKWKKRFEAKCTNQKCGWETDHKDEDMKCDVCGSAMRLPDASQTILFEKFMIDGVNENEQMLSDVEEEAENDCNIVDDTYMLISKQYEYDTNGAIISAKPMEILRLHPASMRIIMDTKGRYGYSGDGNRMMVCPEHREQTTATDRCPKCQLQTYPAYFVASMTGSDKVYYMQNEVWHGNRYRKSLRYGFPPILTLYYKVLNLIAQDKLYKETFEGQRSPKGLLLFPTSNRSSLTTSWEEMLEKIKALPGSLWPMMVEQNALAGKAQAAQYIDMMKTPQEMQLIDFRQELRQSIGAIYGVSPVFQNDVSTSGGLNNEGLQITVTVRSATKGQNFWNRWREFLMKQFGITDYIYILNEIEEKDEAAEQDLEEKKINNARLMLMMGFDVERDSEGNFIFSGVAQQATDPFSMYGNSNPPNAFTPRANALPPANPKNQDTSQVGDNRQDGSPTNKGIEETETNFEGKLKKKINQAKAGIADILSNYLQKKQIFEIKKGDQENLQAQIEAMLNSEEYKSIVYAGIASEFTNGISSFEKKFDMNIIPNQNVLSFLQEYTFSNIKNMNIELAGKLKQIITRGIVDGITKRELAQQINTALDAGKARASAIAQTETLRAYQQGSLSAAKDSGIKLKKYVFNPNPISDICRNLVTKSPIPLNKQFKYQGESWDAPPFHVNCKSEVIYEEA